MRVELVLLVLLVSSALAHFPIRCVPFPEGTESEYCGDSLPSTTCVRDFGDENLRGNASIYNEEQFEYLNSEVFKFSKCEADPDSVPGYPTTESLCVSQACETDDDCYAIFLLWNYHPDTGEYTYEIPNRCLDYCLHCAPDQDAADICEFSFEHAMGVTNSSTCQDPTQGNNNESSDQNETVPETTDDNAISFVLVTSVVFGIIVIVTVVIVAIVVIKNRQKAKLSFDINNDPAEDSTNLDDVFSAEDDEEIII